MTSNVIPLGGVTSLDLSTDRILEEAKGHCTDGVVVLGWDDDGELYAVSSIASGSMMNWLLDRAKMMLLTYEGE